MSKEERAHYIDIIEDYLCCKNKCDKCDDYQVEQCYVTACNTCNRSFAESLNYNGFDTEEEFWDDLYD